MTEEGTPKMPEMGNSQERVPKQETINFENPENWMLKGEIVGMPIIWQADQWESEAKTMSVEEKRTFLDKFSGHVLKVLEKKSAEVKEIIQNTDSEAGTFGDDLKEFIKVGSSDPCARVRFRIFVNKHEGDYRVEFYDKDKTILIHDEKLPEVDILVNASPNAPASRFVKYVSPRYVSIPESQFDDSSLTAEDIEKLPGFFAGVYGTDDIKGFMSNKHIDKYKVKGGGYHQEETKASVIPHLE